MRKALNSIKAVYTKFASLHPVAATIVALVLGIVLIFSIFWTVTLEYSNGKWSWKIMTKDAIPKIAKEVLK